MNRRRTLAVAAVALTCLWWSVAAPAANTPADAGSGPGSVGIVLMHGKKSTPGHLSGLADELIAAGYRVVTPEMPWSQARAYDEPLAEAHEEIDAAVTTVMAMGANRVVIAGHSMGANMAMGYAATHPGLSAVIAIGPGQTVEADSFGRALGASVAQARDLVAGGRGDVPQTFADLHLGTVGTARATARVYLSYFASDGLANMPATTPKLTAPLLWIVGTRDKNMMDRGRAYAFDRTPADPLNRYAEVPADHMGTPAVSGQVIRDWLATVLARP